MGYTLARSWSHSRSTALAQCPRSAWYAHYCWGEPHQDMARLLKRSANCQSLAGTIVHDLLDIGLRQLGRNGVYPDGLAARGAKRFDVALQASRNAVETLNGGKRPSNSAVVLRHHLDGKDDEAGEAIGRETVETSLASFRDSKILRVLAATDARGWHIPDEESRQVPFFDATAECGFTGAVGLRLYAAWDLKLQVGDDLVIVDHKTGKRNSHTEAAARRQLATYTLAAIAGGSRPDRVRVVTHWLGDDAHWEPRAVEIAELEAIVAHVETDHAYESSLVDPVADENGVVHKHVAREEFEARPAERTCRWCPYSRLCHHGCQMLGLPVAQG